MTLSSSRDDDVRHSPLAVAEHGEKVAVDHPDAWDFTRRSATRGPSARRSYPRQRSPDHPALATTECSPLLSTTSTEMLIAALPNCGPMLSVPSAASFSQGGTAGPPAFGEEIKAVGRGAARGGQVPDG